MPTKPKNEGNTLLKIIKQLFCGHDFKLLYRAKIRTTFLGMKIFYKELECKKCGLRNCGEFNN